MKLAAFNLQKQIAIFLLDQLENKKITIKRAAEIAKQVLNIIPEDAGGDVDVSEMISMKIKEQLATIPELISLKL